MEQLYFKVAVRGDGLRVAGGGWRVAGDGLRVTGCGWRVAGAGDLCLAYSAI